MVFCNISVFVEGAIAEPRSGYLQPGMMGVLFIYNQVPWVYNY